MPLTKEARRQTRAGRFYEVDGIGTVPSVTTVLQVIAKPALLNWMAKVEREMVLGVSADLYEATHDTPKMTRTAWFTTMETRLGKAKAGARELAKAGDLGRQAHEMIEWETKRRIGIVPGPKPVICDKALWAFMAWEDWAKSVNLKPLLIEEVVFSETYGYAGTMDLYAELDHEGRRQLALVDYKTGKGIYGEAHLQNAAYRNALRELGHGDPELGLIVRLPKVETDPEFEVKIATPEKPSLEVFLHFMAGWKWQQAEEEEYESRKTPAAPVTTKPEEITQKLEQSIEQAKANGNGLPKAEIPPSPFHPGEGTVLSTQFAESKGRPYVIIQQGGHTIYATENVDLPVENGKTAKLFDLLKCADGSDCRFSVVKQKTKAGMSHKVVGVAQIGPFAWDETGSPIYRPTTADTPF